MPKSIAAAEKGHDGIAEGRRALPLPAFVEAGLIEVTSQ
jgi:hypothetical protein